jgi:hypothetical protein
MMLLALDLAPKDLAEDRRAAVAAEAATAFLPAGRRGGSRRYAGAPPQAHARLVSEAPALQSDPPTNLDPPAAEKESFSTSRPRTRPIVSASSLTDIGLPVAMFRMRPLTPAAVAASRLASTTFATYEVARLHPVAVDRHRTTSRSPG